MRLIKSISKRLVRAFGRRDVYIIRGMRLLLDPANHVDFRLAARLPFEEEQIAKTANIIEQEAMNVFIDIGANIGLYTVAVGRLPEVEKVYAFEPVRANYNQLCANIYLNDLNLKVDARRIALGDKVELASIYIEPKSTGRSRLDPNYSGDRNAFTDRETVEIRRLDDCLLMSGERVFIKIDVEGHALAVLRGMEGLLKRNLVHIQVELLEYDRESIIKFLYNIGYEMHVEIDVDGYFRPRRYEADGSELGAGTNAVPK